MMPLYSIFESFHKFLFPLKCLPSRSNSAIYGLIAIQNLSIRIEFILKFTIIYCFDFLGLLENIFYFFVCYSFPTNIFDFFPLWSSSIQVRLCILFAFLTSYKLFCLLVKIYEIGVFIIFSCFFFLKG